MTQAERTAVRALAVIVIALGTMLAIGQGSGAGWRCDDADVFDCGDFSGLHACAGSGTFADCPGQEDCFYCDGSQSVDDVCRRSISAHNCTSTGSVTCGDLICGTCSGSDCDLITNTEKKCSVHTC